MCLWNILFFVTELTVYPIFLLNNKCFTMSLHILLNMIFSGCPIFHHLFNNFCVAQLCSTVWGPMDYSLLGSSVPGILQARILAWIAIPFSRGSSQLRDRTQVSHIAGRFFTSWATTEGPLMFSSVQFSRSVMSDSLQPHELQHARPPCPSPTAGVHSNSRPLSQWCHPSISSSGTHFSSCPQSFPASELCLWLRW